MLRKEIREVVRVIKKSTELETLRLVLQTQEVDIRPDLSTDDYIWHPNTINRHADMHDLMQLFLDAA